MSELKPCPFCGAEPEVLSDMHRTWGLVMHRDGCFFSNFRLHVIPEYDFKAWNTRYVETCEVEFRESGLGGYTRHCGECGADLDCDTRNKQNYCPSCGKKVEG